jgi:transposase
VARWREGNQSATDLAVELGLRRSQLYKWAKKLDEQSSGEALRSLGRPPTGNLSEIEQLRCDLASAQEELAILKKLDAKGAGVSAAIQTRAQQSYLVCSLNGRR